MTKNRPTIVAREAVFSGWNRVEVATVETRSAGGKTERHKREIVHHGHAAVVLTVDRERGVALLVRQWRAPLSDVDVDPFLLEACAGIIDPGETPEACARREAMEELGVTVGTLQHVADVFPSAGTLTERMHLYLAEVSGDYRAAEGGGMEGEGEDIEVVELPLPELFGMAGRGEIIDAKTLILVQALMLQTQSRTER